MYSPRAVSISTACQINSHAAVAVNSVMAVINLADMVLDFWLLGIIIRLPVVVINIWANAKPLQGSADAKLPVMLLNKPINL